MTKHNLTSDLVYNFQKNSPEDQAKVQEAVFEIACQAHGHLHKVKEIFQQQQKFPSLDTQAIKLATQLPELYLSKLEQCNFNPYASELIPSNLQLRYQLRLLKVKLLKSLE